MIRSEARDGWNNRFEFFAMTHGGRFWRLLQRFGPVRSALNASLINRAIGKVPYRPYALSTMAGYTSWPSLTDRTFSGRHLPPSTRLESALPPVEDVMALFERPKGGMKESAKSTTLFAYFAQWFTDGFLRTDPHNALKNTSNHEIDLSNLYGLNGATTEALRSKVGGKLKSQVLNGEEYPPFYYDEHEQPRPEFADLTMTRVLPHFEEQARRKPVDKQLFAVGGDRVNSQVGFLAINVLFLREHNRICDELARAGMTGDERLFQTARMALIVILLKLVIGEYINHITPYYFKFEAAGGAFEDARWYRQNWMAVEFNLLYRWHGLVPDSYRIAGRDVPLEATLFDNKVLIDRGLGGLLEDASLQPAGRIGAFNTPWYLMEVEKKSIELGRLARLATYNEYRALCNFPTVTDFDQISGDPEVQATLRRIYTHVDNIEYYPGIFAEQTRPNSALAGLMGRLVGVDAFSQALTNPLLSARIYNETTFSRKGLEIIDSTRCLSDILHRNLPPGGPHFHLSMWRDRNWDGSPR